MPPCIRTQTTNEVPSSSRPRILVRRGKTRQLSQPLKSWHTGKQIHQRQHRMLASTWADGGAVGSG
eukprot:scaffold17715_cov79-Isochrysis_galbana.AAC.1